MELSEIADACAALNSTWMKVGAGLAPGAVPGSAVTTDVEQFRKFNADGPANLEYAPGQFAGLYLDAIGQHVAALEALVRAARVSVAPWPLVRAELELAGRVGWLLEPDLGTLSGQRRVARFYLEAI